MLGGSEAELHSVKWFLDCRNDHSFFSSSERCNRTHKVLPNPPPKDSNFDDNFCVYRNAGKLSTFYAPNFRNPKLQPREPEDRVYHGVSFLLVVAVLRVYIRRNRSASLTALRNFIRAVEGGRFSD
jgi:hypothetical protein